MPHRVLNFSRKQNSMQQNPGIGGGGGVGADLNKPSSSTTNTQTTNDNDRYIGMMQNNNEMSEGSPELSEDDIYADLYVVGEDEYQIAGITHGSATTSTAAAQFGNNQENNNNLDTISRKTTMVGFRH